MPGTTTDPAGTLPWRIRPLARSKIRVLAPMNTPIEMTAFSSTITPSTISERAPMKQLSSMMVGFGLQRLEHAADAHAAREVHVLADLGARAHRGPGVDHRALVHVGADVHVGGHEDDVLADVGAAARHRGRHDAEAAALELLAGRSARTWSGPCRRTAATPRESAGCSRAGRRAARPS